MPQRRTIRYTAGQSGVLAPMVDVELRGPAGAVVRDGALIDSGADASAFPLHWMKRLGIRKTDCRKSSFESASGLAPQWHHRDDVLCAMILGHEVQLKAVFADTPVALLGRQDFFVAFAVQFDQRRERFTLRAYPR